MVWDVLGEQPTLWFLGMGAGRSQQVGAEPAQPCPQQLETQAAGRSLPARCWIGPLAEWGGTGSAGGDPEHPP